MRSSSSSESQLMMLCICNGQHFLLNCPLFHLTAPYKDSITYVVASMHTNTEISTQISKIPLIVRFPLYVYLNRFCSKKRNVILFGKKSRAKLYRPSAMTTNEQFCYIFIYLHCYLGNGSNDLNQKDPVAQVHHLKSHKSKLEHSLKDS